MHEKLYVMVLVETKNVLMVLIRRSMLPEFSFPEYDDFSTQHYLTVYCNGIILGFFIS